MRKIIGAGLSIVDHLALVTDFPSCEGHTPCLDYQVQGGGMVGTACCAAARLGGDVEIWCRVGDDLAGRQVLQDLAAGGVDTSQCRVEPEGKTGVCMVLVKVTTGERTFIYRRAEHSPQPTPVPDLDSLDEAGVLLVDGHWREAALAAMRRARQIGVTVVADLNYNVRDSEALLALTDVPVLSEYSATVHTGAPDPREAVRRLGEWGARLAVVTRGDQGGLYWLDGQVHHYPAFQVRVVDTTGAGDCFHGALCWALAEKMNPHRAVRFASAAAALNCRRLGGRAALPAREEVLDLLGE